MPNDKIYAVYLSETDLDIVQTILKDNIDRMNELTATVKPDMLDTHRACIVDAIRLSEAFQYQYSEVQLIK